MNIKKLYFLLIIVLCISCKERYSPKPNGYLRIDLQEKKYKLFKPENCTFSFMASEYFQLINKGNCWIDLIYPKHNATIHMTYKDIENDLNRLLEDSRNMVYKHTIKADAINEKLYLNNNQKIYGTLYDIKGEAASSVQFHLTDSLNHFIRGALYFNTNINYDSLAPIINYLRDDVLNIMESLTWEK